MRARTPMVVALVVLQAFGGGVGLAATRTESGFLNRTVAVAGVSRRYQVYVPAGYTAKRAWPVVLCLHGSGERGTDGLLQTEIGFGTALRRYSERYPLIAVFPQCPPDMRWPGAAARIALATLDATLREFHGDPARIYLSGLSMGGNGAWYLAYRDPARWAAILVACGWVTPEANHPTAEPVVPESDGAAVGALAAKLRHVPVWQFHGALDDVISPAHSRALAAALDSLGAPAKYTELPGVGHGSWDAMYASPEVATWLLAQLRPAR